MILEVARQAGASCIYAYDYDSAEMPVGVTGEIRFKGGPKAISNAVLLRFADRNVLAFQGTITQFEDVRSSRTLESVIDWLDNFDVHSSKLPGVPGLVHSGFMKQLNYVAADIVEAVSAMKPAERKKPLIVTGHSQGGAIATIATKLLEGNGIKVQETYTFAAPRSCDADFANSITAPLSRIEFGCDIVPHVPLPVTIAANVRNALALLPLPKKGRELMERLLQHSNLAPDYASAGILYYSRDYGGPIKKYSDPSRYVGLYLERAARLPFNLKRLIEDHHMTHYMDTLNGN